MDNITKSYFKNLQSNDKNVRYEAFRQISTATEEKVDWTYEIWDSMVDDLTHKNNHRRSIAAQILCNLSKSDPEKRMLQDFPDLLEVTKDKRFVTARHCLQSLWKIGAVNKEYREMVVKGLERRFKECVNEKNYTLIRYDIIQGLKLLYDEVKDGDIKKKAFDLITTEEDSKYQKKYETVWKKV